MTIRLYIDEDAMDQNLVRALHARGVDVSTALEEAMIERSDEEHLDYAMALGRVLYSFNIADFCRLHVIYLPAAGGSVARQVSPWHHRCAATALLRGAAGASSGEADRR